MNSKILKKANDVITEARQGSKNTIKSVTMNSVTDAWLTKMGYQYVEVTVTFSNGVVYFTSVTDADNIATPSYYYVEHSGIRKLASTMSEAEATIAYMNNLVSSNVIPEEYLKIIASYEIDENEDDEEAIADHNRIKKAISNYNSYKATIEDMDILKHQVSCIKSEL